jgi:hypothetical protein
MKDFVSTCQMVIDSIEAYAEEQKTVAMMAARITPSQT